MTIIGLYFHWRTKSAQSIVDCYDYDSLGEKPVGSVRAVVAGAGDEAAAVHPYNHGQQASTGLQLYNNEC